MSKESKSRAQLIAEIEMLESQIREQHDGVLDMSDQHPAPQTMDAAELGAWEIDTKKGK